MDECRQKLFKQVSGKIHLGDSEDEVRAWLRDKKNISGDTADEMIKFGRLERRLAVRRRAIVWMISSGVGLLLFAGFLFMQYAGRRLLVGFGVAIVWGLAITAMGVFTRSLWELITGRSEHPL